MLDHIAKKFFIPFAKRFLTEHQNAKLTQEKVFKKIIDKTWETNWGREHGYQKQMSINDFQKNTPISKYEDLYPWIEAMLSGQENMLWPGKVEWFSKSSGTTNDKSKYIPMPKESLEWNHYLAGKIMWGIYYLNFNPKSRALSGKAIGVGGSIDKAKEEFDPQIKAGDLSAVLMKNLPKWAGYFRTPGIDIATMPHWESKLDAMARATMNQNITSLAGVPTWTLLLIKKVMELKKTDDIKTVWPNLEVFFHGAVAFGPYRQTFNDLVKPEIKYLELYNASEGFFGIQDDPNRLNEMALLLGQGVFYEFIPLEELDKENPQTLLIDQVEIGKIYALVITTAGLFRYLIGDTIEFTSTAPYRIKITGRTKHFINAFGEELMVSSADEALARACHLTGAKITDYTAGPIYMDNDKSKGGHEWIIEFENPPADLEEFIDFLDTRLKELNSDYEAKRRADLALARPKINIAPKGTFYKWMENRGRLGGQNKVPRLANDRKYLDDILKMI